MIETEPPWVIAVIRCSQDEHARDRRPCPYLAAIAVVHQAYRPFECSSCGQQVNICGRCDCGHRYCSPGCAAAGRRRSLGKAGRRYQGTRKGRRRNASRQRRHRARRPSLVTHQSSGPEGTSPILQTTQLARGSDRAMAAEAASRSLEMNEVPDRAAPEQSALVHCDFCGRLCGPAIRDHAPRLQARAIWHRRHRRRPRR